MNPVKETFWWALFSAGGVVAAFVIPAMIFLTGFAGAGPAEEALRYENMRSLLSSPLVKIFLFVSVSLPFFHCAHRIRHVLCDIGLGIVKTRLALVFYLAAFGGTVACGVLLWRI